MLAWGWALVRLRLPSHGKGYCVRRRVLIQSLYLRGCINWLQMAHMVLIKDYLTAAGSVRGACTCVSVSVCVCAWVHFVPDQSNIHVYVHKSMNVYMKGLSITTFVESVFPAAHLSTFISVSLVQIHQQIKWVRMHSVNSQWPHCNWHHAHVWIWALKHAYKAPGLLNFSCTASTARPLVWHIKAPKCIKADILFSFS